MRIYIRREERTLIDGFLPIDSFAAHLPAFFGFHHGANHVSDMSVIINNQDTHHTRASDGDPHFQGRSSVEQVRMQQAMHLSLYFPIKT